MIPVAEPGIRQGADTQVTMRRVEDKAEWEAVFGVVARPHLVQSFSYNEAKVKAESWHVKRLAFEERGAPVAIAHVLEKRILGVPVISRINRGPMFLDPAPGVGVVCGVFGALRARWKYGCRGALLVAPALEPTPENEAILTGLGFRNRGLRGWYSGLVSLEPDEDQLRQNLSKSWRSDLRRSERSLVLDISSSRNEFEWLVERHREHMAAKKFRGLGAGFLRAFYNCSPENVLVFRALAGGEPVAGLMVTRFGQTAEGLVGWFGGRKFNSGNFLAWNAMLEMKRRGCRWWDMGGLGSTPDGYTHFKLGVGGVEYRLIGEWMCF
jgi:hypothetical protein